MRKTNIIYNVLTQMAVLLPSVFCALYSNAQISLADRLNYVLEAQDLDTGVKIYNEVTEADLRQLSDSSLFIYHYLGAYINSELLPDNEKNPEKALSHFLEAKRLCETSVGVHSVDYMEIMQGLGDEFIDLGQYEEALGIFQEGIVKSMNTHDSSATQYFSNLILGVQECYERMGWYNEVPEHLYGAWLFWNKDDSPLTSYSYYPLWSLRQFYHRFHMYEKAVNVSDEIIRFITEKGGSNHPELSKELFFRGNTLNDMGKIDEAIETYCRGVNIIVDNKLEFDDNYSYLPILGNLLLALIDAERWDESEMVLNKIENHSDICGDGEIYNTHLSAVAFTLFWKGDYDRALTINTKLLKRNLSEQRKQNADFQQKEILDAQELILSLPELEKSLQNCGLHSNEWFDVALNLLRAYARKKDTEKYIDLLNNIYNGFSINQSIKVKYYSAILGNLFSVCLEKENYDLALKYAIEDWNYVSILPDFSERYKFDCINNLVVAKLKSNKLDGIYDDLEKAAELCRIVFGEESETYAIQLHNKGRALQLSGRHDEAKEEYLRSIALYTKFKGAPMPKTVRYLMETEEQLVDYELDL